MNERTSRSLIERASVFMLISIALIGIGVAVMSARQTAGITTIITLIPTRTGQQERCLTCHNGIEPISPSHSIEEFGCVSCHGGDRLALDAERAHSGMVANPAALDMASTYCGECHSGQIATVQRSLMSTYAGAIALIRRAYGLQPDGEARFAVQPIDGLSAFTVSTDDPHPVQLFAQNCLTCHTNSEPEAVQYQYRSTGCATCHMLYGPDGRYQGGDPTISRTDSGHPLTHTFTTAIPYTQCNHCHNRGNYDLRTMTFVPRADMPLDSPAAISTPSPEAQRLHDYYQPISQFTNCEYELDCIDCHTSHEIMGDAASYNTMADARYVTCATCHGTLDEPPRETTITSADDMAMTYATLNPNVSLSVGDTILITERGEPLYNVRRVGDQWVLTGKVTGESYVVPLVQGSACTQDVNDQSSAACHQCHSVDRNSTP